MPVIYQFSYDSPVRYLPLAYMLPYDVISRYPTLSKLPRSMGALNATPGWGKVILSQQFLNEIMDAVASLAFPHFGFGGWKEHYSGYSPVWRLSYALPLWAKGVEKVRGWGVQALFALPPDYEIPFCDPEDVRQVMKQVVEETIEEQGWGPILEVIRNMPCEEDFERWDTNVRKDFLRKWYHTRSKRVQTVSLEECMEDENSNIHSLPDPKGDFTEQVESEDFCQRFKATLSQKDMAILELRVEGYTLEEIADRLGYKTHSAVVKRMDTNRNQGDKATQPEPGERGFFLSPWLQRRWLSCRALRGPQRPQTGLYRPCTGMGWPTPLTGENIGHRRQNGRKNTVCYSTVYQTQGGTGRCSGSTPRAPEGTVRQQPRHRCPQEQGQFSYHSAHAEVSAGDKQPNQGGRLPDPEGQHHVCGHPHHCQPGVL